MIQKKEKMNILMNITYIMKIKIEGWMSGSIETVLRWYSECFKILYNNII